MKEKLKNWVDGRYDLWLVNAVTNTPIGKKKFVEYFSKYGEWIVERHVIGGLYGTWADVWIRPPRKTYEIMFSFGTGTRDKERITINDTGDFVGMVNEVLGLFYEAVWPGVKILSIKEVADNENV